MLLRRTITTLALRGIRLYQSTLSPDHGWLRPFFPLGCCRYFPTCSEYAAQALERFGLARGGWLGVKRVFRCHPWAQGGFDPLPQQTEGTEKRRMLAHGGVASLTH